LPSARAKTKNDKIGKYDAAVYPELVEGQAKRHVEVANCLSRVKGRIYD